MSDLSCCFVNPKKAKSSGVALEMLVPFEKKGPWQVERCPVNWCR